MPKPPASTGGKATLVGIVGTLTASLLYVTIPEDEGTVYVGYLDIAGIPTKCTGDTRDVAVGRKYSPEECRQSLDRALVAHAAPVMACAPELRSTGLDHARAAAVSLAYNIGTTAFCRSTIARKFNAGDIRGACNGFLAWDKARVKGALRPVKGLTLRRQRERLLCLKDAA